MQIDSTLDEGFPVFWLELPHLFGFVRSAAALALVAEDPDAMSARRAPVDTCGAPDFGVTSEHTGPTLRQHVATQPVLSRCSSAGGVDKPRSAALAPEHPGG